MEKRRSTSPMSVVDSRRDAIVAHLRSTRKKDSRPCRGRIAGRLKRHPKKETPNRLADKRFGVDGTFGLKWTGAGSNRRHTDFQSVALPTELPVQSSQHVWLKTLATACFSRPRLGSGRSSCPSPPGTRVRQSNANIFTRKGGTANPEPTRVQPDLGRKRGPDLRSDSTPTVAPG